MTLSSIPNSFLGGFSNSISFALREELFNNQSPEQQERFRRLDAIGTPPANFLPNPGITEIARQAAWENLSDASREAFRASANTPVAGQQGQLVTSAPTNPNEVRTSGFGSVNAPGDAAGDPLDFTGNVDSLSAEPTSETLIAFRRIWGDQIRLTGGDINQDGNLTPDLNGVIGNNATGPAGPNANFAANGGAVFTGVRIGRTDELLDEVVTTTTYASGSTQAGIFADQIKRQAQEIANRFNLGGNQGLIGYDLNGDGRINDETELLGFDVNGNPSPSLAAVLPELQTDGDRVALNTSDPSGRFNRLFLLNANGQSVRLNQSSIAATPLNAGGTTPYTAAQTVLQVTDGQLEVVVYTRQGFSVDPDDINITFSGTSAGTSTFVQVAAGTGLNRAVNPFDDSTDEFDDFEDALTDEVTTFLDTVFDGTAPVGFAYDFDGSGSIGAGETLVSGDNDSEDLFNFLNARITAQGGRLNLADAASSGGTLTGIDRDGGAANGADDTFDINRLFAVPLTGAITANQSLVVNDVGGTGANVQLQTVLTGSSGAGYRLTAASGTVVGAGVAADIRAGLQDTTESIVTAGSQPDIGTQVATATSALLATLDGNQQTAGVFEDAVLLYETSPGVREEFRGGNSSNAVYRAFQELTTQVNTTANGRISLRDIVANANFDPNDLYVRVTDAGGVTQEVQVLSAAAQTGTAVSPLGPTNIDFTADIAIARNSAGQLAIVGATELTTPPQIVIRGGEERTTESVVTASSSASINTNADTAVDTVLAVIGTSPDISPRRLAYDLDEDGTITATELLGDPAVDATFTALFAALDAASGNRLDLSDGIVGGVDLDNLFVVPLNALGTAVRLNQRNTAGTTSQVTAQTVLQYNALGNPSGAPTRALEVAVYTRSGTSFNI